MNSLIRNSLKTLLGNAAFKTELRGILEEVEKTPIVARGFIRREDPPKEPKAPAEEPPAPEEEVQVEVDDVLMEKIVSSLTGNKDFINSIAEAVSALNPEPPMTPEDAEEIKQGLKELQRGLESYLETEGNSPLQRARSNQTIYKKAQDLSHKANITISKMKR